MTINKNLYSDIQDAVTRGDAAAALINENKRAVNETITYLNIFEMERGSAAIADVSTNEQMVDGAAGVLPTTEQVRKNHVAAVSTITALRALNPVIDGQQINFLGSIYTYDQSDTSTPENLPRVIVGNSGERYKLLNEALLKASSSEAGSGLSDNIPSVTQVVEISKLVCRQKTESKKTLYPHPPTNLRYPAEYRNSWLSKFPNIPMPLIDKDGVNRSFKPIDMSPFPDYQTNSSLAVMYIDVSSGNDANDGSTWALAKKSLNSALTAFPRPDVVYVKSGYYLRQTNTNLFTTDPSVLIDTDIMFIAVGGPVVTAVHDVVTWSLVSGTAYSTSTTVTGTAENRFLHCTDIIGEDGDPLRLTKVFTQAECINTFGTFYYSSGTLTVNIGKQPGPYSVVVPLALQYVRVADANVYFENFEFLGYAGIIAKPTVAGTFTRITCNNVGFNCIYDNAFSNRNAESFLFNCHGSNSLADGYNYHSFDQATNTNPCFGYEENCTFFNAGDGNDNSHNGSTSHTGSVILRINCSYARTRGPVVADVNSGTMSLNYKVSAGQALDGADLVSTVPFICTSGDAKMWLDSCASYGNDYYASRTGSTELFISNFEVEDSATTVTGLTPY